MSIARGRERPGAAPWDRRLPASLAGGRERPGAGPLFAFLAGAVLSVVLSVTVAAGPPILARRWSLLALLGLWSLAWLVVVAATFRLPRRTALGLVLATALALRLAALAGPPATSDDLYRYSWDGRVQAAGLDPYAHTPAAPSMAGLREGWLWPALAGCAALYRPVGCTRINRPTVRTIYPPVAEAWFAAVYRIAGIGSHHKAWQVAGLITDLGVVALLVLALRRWRRDPRWVALYALCPAPVLEIVNNGHVDGLAIALVVGALVMAVEPPGPRPGRISGAGADLAAGALLGLAALVKLYPALLIVALVGRRDGRRLAVLARSGGAAAVVAGAAYLPHVIRVGGHAFGFLTGYLQEEHYTAGGRFLVAEALRVPGGLAAPVSVAALLAVVGWVLWRRPPVPIGTAALLGGLLLVTSPVQPWYAVALLAVAVAAQRPGWAAVLVAGYPYFFAVILDATHIVGIGQWSYGAALGAVAAVSFHRRLIAAAPRRVAPSATSAPESVTVR